MEIPDSDQAIHAGQPPATEGVWRRRSITAAAQALGWQGELRGPVQFGGITFVAVRRSRDVGAPGSAWLAGCLVPGTDAHTAMQDASLLAGYSPRAILVSSPVDTVELQLQTALLDQGAIVETREGPVQISLPGEVVLSPLQQNDVWRRDKRWLAFAQAIDSANLISYS